MPLLHLGFRSAMQDRPSEPPRDRRRYRIRFGMRTLFAALTVAILVFACLFNFWWLPWQEQKDTVDLIKSRLGMGEGEMGDYKYESMEEFPWWKREFASRLGRDSVSRVTTAYSEGTGYPIDISAWKGLKGVETVSFDRALVDDLSVLKELPRLRIFKAFQVGTNPAPGKGLEVLGQCQKLEHVSLQSSFPMNDDVLDSLCKADNIRFLKFDANQVRDLSPLAKLPNLEELILSVNPHQENLNLQPIGVLPNLKRLTLRFYRGQRPQTLLFLTNLKALEYFEIRCPLDDLQRKEILDHVPNNCEVIVE